MSAQVPEAVALRLLTLAEGLQGYIGHACECEGEGPERIDHEDPLCYYFETLYEIAGAEYPMPRNAEGAS